MNPERSKAYEMQAEILQAVAHPIRLAIVDLLADGERCVCEIAGQVGASRSNVSRHLAVMLRAGVLESRKEGLQVFYALRTPCVTGFLTCVGQLIRHNHARSTEILSQL